MLRNLVSATIKLYQQQLRVLFPSSCRFVPSCSEYTRQAVIKYGLAQGFWLGIKRILKCNPCYGKSGDDPVI